MKEKKIKGKWWDISVDGEMKEIQAKKGTWELDPAGYFLIKVNREAETIEVGFCTNDHKLRAKIVGKHPIELYYTLVREGMITRLDHAADVGVELQKAYLALKNNLEYVQDSELALSG